MYLGLTFSLLTTKQLRSRLAEKLELRGVSPIKTRRMLGIFLFDDIDRRQNIGVLGRSHNLAKNPTAQN